jgi:opacity protein-like surface antigen
MDTFFSQEDWTIQVEPAAWYVAPGGKLNMARTGIGGDRLFLSDLNTDSPRFSPFVEAHLKFDRARLTVSGFSLSARGVAPAAIDGLIGGTPTAAGDELRTKLDFTSFEATGAYQVVRFPSEKGECVRLADGRLCFNVGVDAVAGVRYYETHFDVSRSLGGQASASETFAEPILGAKVTAEFNERYTIDLQVSFGRWNSGGDRTSSSWDILLGGQWHPTHNIGVQLGYRSLSTDLRHGRGTDRFEYNGALQGLYGGLVVRF